MIARDRSSAARATADAGVEILDLRPGDSPARLVARAKLGDRDAFAALYEANVEGISRYVAAMFRNTDRAEDIVAQTFMLAWKSLASLREHGRFSPWLFRIAHNETLRELRRRTMVPLDDAPDPVDPSRFSSPVLLMETKVDSDRVRQALLDLSPAHREVLTLRFFRELPHAEIAHELGKSEVAVRALQYRALQSLRERLGEWSD